MYNLRLLPQLALVSLYAASSWAQVVENLSFGHRPPISPNGQGIPGWHISSLNHQIQILSDRLILTPPVPGNARGALWTDEAATLDTWTAELEFRTMGQDGGSGNLQMWYVKDKSTIDTNSVYTVGKFDGLALSIGQNGAQGGIIRGFLNDGGQSYTAHGRSVNSLAFGHCQYNFRNLGRPSKISIRSGTGLKVLVDNQECFSSDKISLPSGYYFGITGATPDIPDSFELEKFVVAAGADGTPQSYGRMPPRDEQQEANRKPAQLQRLDRFPGSPEVLPDQAADEISSQTDQFADLHNRLQGISHQIGSIFNELNALSERLDQRHEQLLGRTPQGNQDSLSGLERKLEQMQRTIDEVRRDGENKDYRETLERLNRAVEGVKGGLRDSLPDTISGIVSKSAPRMGPFVAVIVAVQIMLAGSYIVYKRRRNSMPKKYL